MHGRPEMQSPSHTGGLSLLATRRVQPSGGPAAVKSPREVSGPVDPLDDFVGKFFYRMCALGGLASPVDCFHLRYARVVIAGRKAVEVTASVRAATRAFCGG